jgi:hypothetical protein
VLRMVRMKEVGLEGKNLLIDVSIIHNSRKTLTGGLGTPLLCLPSRI